jgi:hypothetical protein
MNTGFNSLKKFQIGNSKILSIPGFNSHSSTFHSWSYSLLMVAPLNIDEFDILSLDSGRQLKKIEIDKEIHHSSAIGKKMMNTVHQSGGGEMFTHASPW